MTKEEAAIVSAYTGILVGNFSDMHAYVENKFERPVWTHEFASKEFFDKVKEAAYEDFIKLVVK